MAIDIIRVTDGDGVLGVQRNRAHRFYFREGMYVVSFNFKKDLGK